MGNTETDAIMELGFHCDPSHGWLEVPEKVCTDLGVVLSGYSYVSADGRMYYAEEDCDAALVVSALQKAGFEVRFTEVFHEERFPEKYKLNQIIMSRQPSAAACGVVPV